MALVLAMILDAIFGEPRWIWSRVAHPAVLMGNAIDWFDRRFNNGANQKLRGTLVVLLLSCIAGAFGVGLAMLPGIWAEVAVGAILFAQRSLSDHVRAVAEGLALSDDDGRKAVAMIVGRDTADMDTSDISRAAIESAAENFSDGVIAPVFWFFIAGLPGLLIYKMINTCDSMVGYLTPKHRDFGWASAKLDDLVNWVPARISAALIIIGSLKPSAAKIIRRDAALHRSPNAGWPEAAMAGVLGVALSGPRKYDGKHIDYPWVHPDGQKMLRSEDIHRSTHVLWRAWVVCMGLVAILYLIIGA